RLIATANFLNGRLRYDGEKFCFADEIYWPARLRRHCLDPYLGAPLKAKRQTVKAAIVGDIQTSLKLGIIPPDLAGRIFQSLLHLIRQFLKPSIIRRLSASLGPVAERSDHHEPAARLYLQAGDLPNAIRCATHAIKTLSEQHRGVEAVRLINQVVEYATLTGVTIAARRLLMMKGDILKQAGDTNQALVTYETIIELYKDLPVDELLGETYKDLGDLYRMKQDCNQGLKCLHKASDIYTELNAELELSHTLNNIGNIHWIAGNLDDAVASYRKALRVQRRLKAVPEIASTLSNIGSVYAIKGRFRRSIHVMELALRLKRTIGDNGEIARSLNNLGYVHHISGRSGEAVSFLSESLDINRRIGSKKEVLYNLENLTDVMIAAGRLREALPYLTEGHTISDELNDCPHCAAFTLNR
ncbi:MAG: tetratricopeptide repeat protein, partial [Candidatus Zixiibacteriota bacterium]